MQLEVIFYDRIGGYNAGDIAILDDSLFVRAAVMGGKADVINPPDWTLEKADDLKAAEDKAKQEMDYGESDNQPGPSEADSGDSSDAPKRTRKKGSEGSGDNEGDST